MSDDPYGTLDEQPEQPATASPAAPPAPRVQPHPVAPSEPLGYSYEDANTDYAYGPPPQQPGYGQQQGAYGVPFYGQPQASYLPVMPAFTQRPLIDDPTAADAPLRGASPLEAYKRFWTRGATFTGRASRSEYWWPALIHGLGWIGYMGIADALYATTFPGGFLGTIGWLFFLAALVPSIALGVRRLHDTDNSGLLHLLSLIPYAGVVVQAVLMAQPSSPNGMRYDKVNRR